MNSISVRLLLAAALLMTAFIGVTTMAIAHAVDQRARQALEERMQGQIYALLGVTEIDDNGNIDIHEADLPNGLMRQPASGTYAEVRDTAEQQVWLPITDNCHTEQHRRRHRSVDVFKRERCHPRLDIH